MEFGSVHERMREASKQVLELYGEHARDWAPREVAEITENAQLGWMANLTDALEIWRAKIHEEMSDGERILAYVNLGMLLECWLTLYLCVWLRDYKKQAKDGRMPYELTFNEMETFFEEKVWEEWPEGKKWSPWIDKIRRYRNAVHPFMRRDIGTTDELRDDLNKFDQLIVDEFSPALLLDYDESLVDSEEN